MCNLENSIYTLSSLLNKNENTNIESIKLDFMEEYKKFFFKFFETKGLKFPKKFMPDMLLPLYSSTNENNKKKYNR